MKKENILTLETIVDFLIIISSIVLGISLGSELGKWDFTSRMIVYFIFIVFITFLIVIKNKHQSRRENRILRYLSKINNKLK